MTEEAKKGGLTLGQFAGGIIAIFLAVSLCSRDESAGDGSAGKPTDAQLAAELEATAAIDEGRKAQEALAAEQASRPNWSYSSGTDDITGKPWQRAEITSDDYNRLSWPYEGNTYLTITVRKHPRFRGDVAFRVDRGQIQCSSYDGCAGAISIDGKAEKLTLAEPSDNSSDVVFAAYDAAIIRKLKGAKKVVVELPMYRNGNVSWTFSTEGLEWPPKG